MGSHYPDLLLTLPLDVTNQEQSREAVAQAIKRFARIDVLVNNAGYGLVDDVEESTDDDVDVLPLA